MTKTKRKLTRDELLDRVIESSGIRELDQQHVAEIEEQRAQAAKDLQALEAQHKAAIPARQAKIEALAKRGGIIRQHLNKAMGELAQAEGEMTTAALDYDRQRMILRNTLFDLQLPVVADAIARWENLITQIRAQQRNWTSRNWIGPERRTFERSNGEAIARVVLPLEAAVREARDRLPELEDPSAEITRIDALFDAVDLAKVEKELAQHHEAAAEEQFQRTLTAQSQERPKPFGWHPGVNVADI
jgi:hypothetical protein